MYSFLFYSHLFEIPSVQDVLSSVQCVMCISVFIVRVQCPNWRWAPFRVSQLVQVSFFLTSRPSMYERKAWHKVNTQFVIL